VASPQWNQLTVARKLTQNENKGFKALLLTLALPVRMFGNARQLPKSITVREILQGLQG
jgi:hypothetical protein